MGSEKVCCLINVLVKFKKEDCELINDVLMMFREPLAPLLVEEEFPSLTIKAAKPRRSFVEVTGYLVSINAVTEKETDNFKKRMILKQNVCC